MIKNLIELSRISTRKRVAELKASSKLTEYLVISTSHAMDTDQSFTDSSTKVTVLFCLSRNVGHDPYHSSSQIR